MDNISPEIQNYINILEKTYYEKYEQPWVLARKRGRAQASPRLIFIKMIPEEIYKETLIQALKSIDNDWVDGDKELGRKKTVDIVNHTLKIAIEVKDDTKYKTIVPPRSGVMVTQSVDLTKMNQRFGDHVRSANNKFKEYQGYKTILLFRTEFLTTDVIRYAVEGLHSYSKPKDCLVYIGRRGKYSKHNRQTIGCFVVINQEAHYFPNVFAEENRLLNKKEVEKIFGQSFKDVPAI